MSEPAPATDRTTGWRACDAALTSRGLLLIWFDPQAERLVVPRGRCGRLATFSDAAIQTCLMLKALLGLALPQTTGLVASLLKLAGLAGAGLRATPCRRRMGLTVAVPRRPSTKALHLLIESTSIKAAGEGKRSTRKRGASHPRQWCKVHLP